MLQNIIESKMKSIMISVVILTYYHEKYIRQAIESVINQQTNYNIEIVIGDDASKDCTLEIIEEYKKKYPDLIYLVSNEKNVGISENLYRTLCRCRGKYISILAGDDYLIDMKKFDDEIVFLEAHTEYVAVATCLEHRLDFAIEPFQRTPRKKIRGKEVTLEMFLKGEDFASAGLMMCNVLLTEKGRSYYELIPEINSKVDDLTFCLLLLKSGRVYNSNKFTYAHRSFRETSDKNNYNSIFSRIDKFKNAVDNLNALHDYYGNAIDLSTRYRIVVTYGMLIALVENKWKCFNEVFYKIPKEFQKVKIQSSFHIIPLGFHFILKSIKNGK